jgi:transcriptional regulator with XRE-family HTH domain
LRYRQNDAAVPDPIATRFGQNLMHLRESAGISQEELGFRASLHRTEIGMLERGTRLARVDTLIKLAGALEVEANALVEGLNWSPGEHRVGNFSVADD